MSFLELVKMRHSVRNYENRAVEKEKLDYIMECVRLAPSAVNFQPWKFAVITDADRLSQLKKAYPREWIENVPCMIVACANHEESWHRKSDGKDHADIDVAIAESIFVWLLRNKDWALAGCVILMYLCVGKYLTCLILWNR